MATATPQSSGTYNFGLSNGQIVFEAFDRIGKRPTEIDRHQIISARTSLNLELQSWSNRGINLWKMVSGQIALQAGVATYPIQPQLVDMTEMYYTTVDPTGGPNSTDRIMTPITRTAYAMQSDKLTAGTPTQFWFQRLISPQVTLWQPPAYGAPAYVCNWWGLERIQDAGIANAETPDVVYRALDALCAGLTARVAEKFAPAMLDKKMMLAKAAFAEFAADDQEGGPVIMQPNVAGYWRL